MGVSVHRGTTAVRLTDPSVAYEEEVQPEKVARNLGE